MHKLSTNDPEQRITDSLSRAHYLEKDNFNKLDIKKLWEKLRKIKPEVKFTSEFANAFKS